MVLGFTERRKRLTPIEMIGRSWPQGAHPLAKSRNPDTTRAHLLKSATQEFARHGFHGARVDRIVKRAGCNMRMLYHYFENKENLYLKVLELVYFDIRKKERQLELDEVEPVEALRRLVRFTWDHFTANRVFIDITRNENLVGGRFVRRSVVISEMSSPLIELIADIIRRGLESKQFRYPTTRSSSIFRLSRFARITLTTSIRCQPRFKRTLKMSIGWMRASITLKRWCSVLSAQMSQ